MKQCIKYLFLRELILKTFFKIIVRKTLFKRILLYLHLLDMKSFHRVFTQIKYDVPAYYFSPNIYGIGCMHYNFDKNSQNELI